jgi:hypothetical protein
MTFNSRGPIRAGSCVLCLFLAGTVAARAQSSATGAQANSSTDLDTKIRALSESLDQTRVELSESRAEIRELRSMLEQVLKKEGQPASAAAGTTARYSAPGETVATAPATEFAAAQSDDRPTQFGQEEWQMLKERLDELHQIKVESASKYRLKLSGLVLLNVSGISGQVDNTDVPSEAVGPSAGTAPGSVGASLRQSILGLDGIGPTIWGARTSGDVQMDFFGGLPSGYGSETSGLARLRVARIRFDWTNTSIVGGLDVPFFSPNMPASYLTVAEPAFAASGNLWSWAPTVRIEHRFDTSRAQIKLQAGFIDAPVYSDQQSGERTPSAGESSRQPTYAIRVSANGKDESRPMSFGFSGVYSPQRYPGDFGVSGWGAIGDWKFPILKQLELSGQIFTGRGLDGFGGVPTLSAASVYYEFGAPVSGQIEQIPMFGGWSQLKFKLDARSEFNVAAGMGGRNSSELRALGVSNADVYYVSPRNQMLLVNYIFRPRSDLLFSPEFRRLRTYPITGAPMLANQFGVSAGFLF